MQRAEQLKTKIRQLNVWVIVALVAILLAFSLWNQKILDSDFLAIYIVPGVYKLGLMTIFALYVMTIIVVVNWAYYSIFKLTRSNFYDPRQREELVRILKDPEVQGNIELFRERTAKLVSRHSNYLSEIIGSMLPNAIKQPFMLEQYFRAKVDNISDRFSEGINTINLLSNLAPIVGFFGTLLGMIKAFHESSMTMIREEQMTADAFSALQAALMIAIITSIYGVSLKILGSILRHHLLTRINNIGDEIAQVPVEVLYEE